MCDKCNTTSALTQGQTMGKKCNENLEKYKILYTAYADEIRNLWQRSIFLGAFMTLAWGGYGALQLKILDNTHNISVGYYCASFGICLVIIVLSLLWVAMAKGSKFVQKAHEEHIKKFISNDDSVKKLYCNLKDYGYLSESENLFSFGVLTPFRYSPSKINIALGWISAYLSGALIVIHIFMPLFSSVKLLCNLPIATLIVIAIICAIIEIFLMLYVFCKMKDYLKGENKMQCKSNLGGGVARKDS